MSAMLGVLMMAAGFSPDAVAGRWKTESRGGIVEIARCGSSICGKLLTSDGIAENPALKDLNNKKVALRGRTLKDLQILGGFAFDDGLWKGGTIYNAEDGKVYSAQITQTDANTLKLRGCIFVPLCKTQTWTRVR